MTVTVLQFSVALVAIAVALSAVMSLGWVIEQRSGNSGWIDTVWTFGLGIVGVAAALFPLATDMPGAAPRRILAAVAVTAWALRLGVHIAQRTAGIADDPRYAELRKNYGAQASWQMWLLVQKQALVSIPFALAIFLAAHNPAPALRPQDCLAIAVFAVAIVGEALADAQLRRFRRMSSERGSICDVGLWSWSRHPNYFFQWFGWLGYPLIAIDPAGHYGWGWLALLAPAGMYWLLVYVSGIPPLERHMLNTRGAKFRDYAARTNAFFPWPPRPLAEAVQP